MPGATRRPSLVVQATYRRATGHVSATLKISPTFGCTNFTPGRRPPGRPRGQGWRKTRDCDRISPGVVLARRVPRIEQPSRGAALSSSCGRLTHETTHVEDRGVPG